MTQESKNNVHSDDDKKFTVTDHTEIIRILRGLARGLDTVSAIYHGGSDIMLTAVLDIDPQQNIVYLDTNVSEATNNRLRASKRTIFVSVTDGVKVQWVSTEINFTEFEGRGAFSIAIPETLQRVQRRGLFRINTPLINPLMCKIQITENLTVDVALVDICAEGIGILLPDPLVTELERGARFEQCSINFPEIGVVPMTLIVQSVWEITLKNGSLSRRAGLEFADMRSSSQSKVQRYINTLQRIRINNTPHR